MVQRLVNAPGLYFGLAALLLVGGLFVSLEISLPSRPRGDVQDVLALPERDDLNLLFIVIDTLRADRLGSYGYERDTSPVLDDLASVGIRFDSVLSQSSWTKTSMASLWTGTFPSTHQILRFNHSLPEAAVLPAEILRDAGLVTAGIYRNGWVAPNFGFSQGFGVYVQPRPGADPERVQAHNPSSGPLQGTDEDATRGAIEFLRTHGQSRFFLYVHYMDVHQYAYASAFALFGTSYSDVYDNAIRWTDFNVGVLVKTLDDLGVLDRTLIAITSDHGEGFQEHDQEGHARTLYREVTEVPFILAPPVRLSPGIVVRQRVQNVDVWPTLLELMGMPPLPHTDGRSLLPLVEAAATGREDGAPPLAFAQLDRAWGWPNRKPRPLVLVTDGRYRLIEYVEDPDTAQLFDASDPGDSKNLAARKPEVVEELRTLRDGQLEQSTPPWGEAQEVELDSMRLDQLRALGYVIR